MKLQLGCSMCRRAGEKLFLKGERCESQKCAITRRKYAPGMHGPKPKKKKASNYNAQLRMKQKAKQIYGLREKQFRVLFEKVSKKKGDIGKNLLQALESRLDNVIYRTQLAHSRMQARQLVSHGHFLVNGRRVDVPSLTVAPNDTITIRTKSVASPYFKESVRTVQTKSLPDWIVWNEATHTAHMVKQPPVDESQHIIDTKQIIEFYSR